MTRREFLLSSATVAGASRRLAVPLHRVMDAHPQCPPEVIQRFWWKLWPEAYRTFSTSGIDLETSDETGAIKRSPGDRPIFVGLRRDRLNLVLTGHIPMHWDRGRALAGVTTIYDGYHLCLIAMRYAHGNQVPWFSTNTCVHELLHALLGDILVAHPTGRQVLEREFRVDWHATRLWLFHDGAAVRQSARPYLDRLAARAATSRRPGTAALPGS